MAEEIESPCIGVCAVDGRSGLCEGCGRKLKEIAGWRGYSAPERAEIMAALPERMKAAGFKIRERT
ncbi:conserved protein [Tepidicaulis marinus]|jgi:hypothetical protein|uniref:Conserved protein n=1 Tax=Tepidicaulis marinus TaxID=1333998 RepID=A0A081BAY4_9HYPH|nr:DUF1289 domain-containing protein [Tepidicaulis marinus]GAK45202.1 conserved protein [Tepidicaulis marinus]